MQRVAGHPVASGIDVTVREGGALAITEDMMDGNVGAAAHVPLAQLPVMQSWLPPHPWSIS